MARKTLSKRIQILKNNFADIIPFSRFSAITAQLETELIQQGYTDILSFFNLGTQEILNILENARTTALKTNPKLNITDDDITFTIVSLCEVFNEGQPWYGTYIINNPTTPPNIKQKTFQNNCKSY